MQREKRGILERRERLRSLRFGGVAGEYAARGICEVVAIAGADKKTAPAVCYGRDENERVFSFAASSYSYFLTVRLPLLLM